jgi:glutamyl endopeptidase
MQKLKLVLYVFGMALLLAAFAPTPRALANKPSPDDLNWTITSDGKRFKASRTTQEMWLPHPAMQTSEKTPEAVVGPDSRKQVTTADIKPWSAIALLAIVWSDNSTDGCTGWFVNARTVVTAGHCVYNRDKNLGWARSIEVYPGYNADNPTNPFPNGHSSMYRMFVNTGWSDHGYRDYDYGAIQINDPLGDTVGHFGFYNAGKNALEGNQVRVTGYPGDKKAGTMWTAKDIVNKGKGRRYIHQVDTYGGESGAPMYHKKNSCYPCVVGIHVAHYDNGYWKGYNIAVRIISDVKNNLNAWMNYPYP